MYLLSIFKLSAKLTGYITAWQNNNHHGIPTPSKQHLKLGLVHFQFVLVDLYKVFAAADFSYSWNMDGKVLEGAPNVTVNFTTPRLVHVALKVDANVNGKKYHEVVYINVTITSKFFHIEDTLYCINHSLYFRYYFYQCLFVRLTSPVFAHSTPVFWYMLFFNKKLLYKKVVLDSQKVKQV